MRWRETELEKIHKELFRESTETKYYTLGVAQGVAYIYQLLSKELDDDKSVQWLEAIKNHFLTDATYGEYFSRLIKTVDDNEFKFTANKS